MIKQYRKNKLISDLEFDYESLKLYQQAKEDIIIELKSHPEHLPEDSFYFIQRLDESISATLFDIDCKLKELYKLGVDVNEH